MPGGHFVGEDDGDFGGPPTAQGLFDGWWAGLSATFPTKIPDGMNWLSLLRTVAGVAFEAGRRSLPEAGPCPEQTGGGDNGFVFTVTSA